MPDTTGSAAAQLISLLRIIIWLAFIVLPAQHSAAQAPQPVIADLAPARMDLCATADDGYLSGHLYGALSEQIEWHGPQMDCGGMLRPNEEGVRLVFAAPRQDERLLIVLGIDGKLDSMADGERTTNITIIDESQNRFFSSGRRERCWSAIKSILPVTDKIVQVTGEVYCAGSLPSLNDNAFVTLRNMQYSGRLLLDEPAQD